MDKKVSVIIPTYNKAGFLPDALRSIFAQGVDGLEVIIVDDGSTDDTPAVVRRWADERGADQVIYLKQPNGGPAAARNAGLARARGEFVAFMDDDDLWLPGSLKKRLDFLEARPDVAMVFADGTNVGPAGVIDASYFASRKPFKAFQAEGYVVTDLFAFVLDVCMVLTPTVVVRRGPLAEVGGFNAKFPVGEDKETWFRLGRRFKLAGLPEVMLTRRIHGTNISSNELLRRRTYVAIAKNIEKTDPVYFRQEAGRIKPWVAKMHREAGYYLLEEGRFLAAAVEYLTSVISVPTWEGLQALLLSVCGALVGMKLYARLRGLARSGTN